MSYTGDKMIEFEEKNWDWLVDKFLKFKNIRDLWDDFVYNEFEKSLQDVPDYQEDR